MPFDLHCHTKISDGSVSIDELITLAKGRGLKGICITDHDTFAGSTRGVLLGLQAGLEVLAGAEVSCCDPSRGNRKVHILCYEPKSPDRLLRMLKKTCDNRKQAMMTALQKITRLYPITVEMVLRRAQGSTNLYKQHVMLTLMDAGYTDRMFGELFQKLFAPKIGLAATHIEYPYVFSAIEEIHGAGGLAVMAHPGEYEGMPLLRELCEKKLLDGIEVFHPRNSGEEQEEMKELAQKYGLIVTGGSDFHGSFTSRPLPLGACTAFDEQAACLKHTDK